MIRRAAAHLAAACLGPLLCAGCWPGDAPPGDGRQQPPGDAELPPRTDCFEELARAPHFVLGRCPDQAHLGVLGITPGGRRVAMQGVGHGIHIDGEAIGADQWSVIVWRPRGDGLSIRYTGHARAPDVEVELDFDGPCLAGRTALSDGRSSALDAVDVFGPGPDATVDELPRWSVSIGSAPTLDAEVGPAPGPLLFADVGVGLALGGLGIERPLSAARGSTPVLRRLDPLAVGDGTWMTARWTLCVEDSGVAALDALADRVADAAAAEPRSTAPRLTAHLPYDPAAPDALADALDAIRRADRFGHLWLSGDWAADRTDWIPREAVGALPGEAEPASLGLIWPALTLPPGSPLLLQHPEWLDAGCAEGCPRLDPRIPAVREHLARIYLDLVSAGFDVRLDGVDHLAPSDQRGLLATLTIDGAPTPTLAPPPDPGRSPVELGLGPAITVPPAPAAAAARHLAFIGGLHPFARVEAAVATTGAPDPAALRQAMALALVGRHGALPPLDGPALDAAIGPVIAAWQQAPDAAAARPLPGSWFGDAETPQPAPLDWRADDRLILFNWSDTPRTVDDPLALAPDLAGAPRLLRPDQPPLGAADRIVIPPGDAVVWATVDGGATGE